MMERWVRPYGHALRQPMFDWIELNAVDVSIQIALIPDRMFPEAATPNGSSVHASS
jgi:hypothetical protein